MKAKNYLFVIMLILGLSLFVSCSFASDIDEEYNDWYDDWDESDLPCYLGYYKDKGLYYKEYMVWNSEKYQAESKIVKVKKGNVLEDHSRKKIKTVKKSGKIITYYKAKQTIALSSTKIKTTTRTIKEITGYYKKVTMPKLKRGKMLTGKFRGEKFKYGNWGFEYGVDISYYSNIYHIKAPGAKKIYENSHGWSFLKKPKYFILYMEGPEKKLMKPIVTYES